MTYLNNRSFCSFKLEQHGLCIEDCTKVIDLDKGNVKAYYRRGQAHLAILEYNKALNDFKAAYRLDGKDKNVKAFLEDTGKLIKRLAFEKAIKSKDELKTWKVALDHLKNQTGGTGNIDKDYTGPVIMNGNGNAHGQVDLDVNTTSSQTQSQSDTDIDLKQPTSNSNSNSTIQTSTSLPPTSILDDPDSHGPWMGTITQSFIDQMIQHFKNGGRLPIKYAWQIILGAMKQFVREDSLVEFRVEEGCTVDVVGDTHGQVSGE